MEFTTFINKLKEESMLDLTEYQKDIINKIAQEYKQSQELKTQLVLEDGNTGHQDDANVSKAQNLAPDNTQEYKQSQEIKQDECFSKELRDRRSTVCDGLNGLPKTSKPSDRLPDNIQEAKQVGCGEMIYDAWDDGDRTYDEFCDGNYLCEECQAKHIIQNTTRQIKEDMKAKQKVKYKCIGRGQIHEDYDYCKKDGGILIEQNSEDKTPSREEQKKRIIEKIQKDYPENSKEALSFAITLATILEKDNQVNYLRKCKAQTKKEILEIINRCVKEHMNEGFNYHITDILKNQIEEIK